MSCCVGHRRSSDPAVAVAVAWASGYSSDWAPGLGNLHMLWVRPKKKKKKKKSIYTMQYYLAIKGNEVLKYATTQMNLENILRKASYKGPWYESQYVTFPE